MCRKKDRWGGYTLLSLEELRSVLLAPLNTRVSLCVAGKINKEEESISLIWGDGIRSNYPLSIFIPNGTTSPNFNDLSIIDHGNTIRLGTYEASVKSILEEGENENI